MIFGLRKRFSFSPVPSLTVESLLPSYPTGSVIRVDPQRSPACVCVPPIFFPIPPDHDEPADLLLLQGGDFSALRAPPLTKIFNPSFMKEAT